MLLAASAFEIIDHDHLSYIFHFYIAYPQSRLSIWIVLTFSLFHVGRSNASSLSFCNRLLILNGNTVKMIARVKAASAAAVKTVFFVMLFMLYAWVLGSARSVHFLDCLRSELRSESLRDYQFRCGNNGWWDKSLQRMIFLESLILSSQNWSH